MAPVGGTDPSAEAGPPGRTELTGEIEPASGGEPLGDADPMGGADPLGGADPTGEIEGVFASVTEDEATIWASRAIPEPGSSSRSSTRSSEPDIPKRSASGMSFTSFRFGSL